MVVERDLRRGPSEVSGRVAVPFVSGPDRSYFGHGATWSGETALAEVGSEMSGCRDLPFVSGSDRNVFGQGATWSLELRPQLRGAGLSWPSCHPLTGSTPAR